MCVITLFMGIYTDIHVIKVYSRIYMHYAYYTAIYARRA